MSTLAAPAVGTPRGSDWHCVLVVLLAGVALWIPRLEGPIDLRYDGGAYYILGTALAEGRGYRLLSEPGEIQAVQYPPLLPLIVAAHQKVLGTSDPVVVGRGLRLSFLLLSLAYAGATYTMARLYLAPRHALLASLLCSLTLYTYFLSDLCFAEIPFALIATLFVVANRSTGRLRGPLTALLGIAGYLLRTMGLALLAAWVGESLLARRFRQAAARAAIALAPIVLWQAYVERVRSGPEYAAPAYAYQRAPYQYYNVSYAENAALIDPFKPELGRASPGDLVERLLANLRLLPSRLGEAVSSPRRFWRLWLDLVCGGLGARHAPRGLPELPVGLLGILVLPGLLVLAAGGERLIPLYVLASLGLICLTPWPAQFVRYLSPLSPFLALSLVRGLVGWTRWLAVHGVRARALGIMAVGAVSAAVLGVQVFALHRTLGRYHASVDYVDASGRASRGRLFYYDDAWRAFETSLAWLRAHAEPGEIVATSAPHFVYLRTGLKAVMPPLEADVETAQRLLDSVPIRYMIVDGLEFTDVSRRYAGPVVQSQSDLWAPVYAGPGDGLRIYRRRD